MRYFLKIALLTKIALFTISAALAPIRAEANTDTVATLGALAPDFKATDMYGKEVSLSDFRGKPVVLEWTNHGCPYVRKHYGSGNMQRLQADLTEEGVVWLSIISSAPGEQGHVTGLEAQQLTAERGAYATTVLLDPEGAIGHLYQARTTPHMYIINEEGVLIYRGGIDDRPSTNPKSLDGAKNYVRAAWAEHKAGNDVSLSSTKPYGCSIKYAE